ncbi:MAG: methionyl-tRNA formyltransferase [Clostridia bacterium]|nr:methionyl-tRNA formyltransferase [Clostridia bacterium]
MRILFMGTPNIAAGCMEKLIDEGFNIVGAVTRVDKPKGRGHKMVPTEVKQAALNHNIPVFQPETLKNGELKIVLGELKPDIIVVVAYGRILPEYVLGYPKYGCINMHASKLPKYRGAAPIQRAVIDGEEETAATVMLMDEGLDTGDILVEKILKIGKEETSGELFDRMTIAGGEVLCEALRNIETITPKKQEGEPLYAHMITKEEAHINWSENNLRICNLIRGMNPYPLAYTYYKDEAVKIIKALPVGLDKGAVGEIVSVSDDGILVKAIEGGVLIKEVRFPGKKTMAVSDYIRGNNIEEGTILK